MSAYYPVLLSLEGRRCVVVGGGRETLERVRALLDAGAQVALISPAPSPEIEQLADQGRIEWRRREFRAADLDAAFLVVSCPADRASNAPVWAAAEARGIPINAVDDTPHCNFIFPAIHRQGELVIAVSSSGKSPALAARIRDRIAGEFGAPYAQFLELAGQLRPEMLQRFPDFDRRRAIWYELVDSPALDHLQAGRPEAALAELRAILDQA
ncbi:MAG: bifunctional precorrin-2 dehydrogenase/sirohydrochlorin ferrochelatase [Bryobacteraceae bacterium]